MANRSASWKTYALRRALGAVPLVFAIILLNFTLIHIAPGDPILLLTGEIAPSPEYIEAMKTKYGLDRPIHEQLLIYLSSVLRGDLGRSIRYDIPVTELIASRAPATLLLMGTSISISILIGILLGVISARKPYSLTDNLTTVFSLIAFSIPIFWLAQLLMITFALQLGLFPTGGFSSARTTLAGIDYALNVLHHLFLPALTIALLRLATTSRLTRASMLEALSQDYVITARSKGLDERTVLFRHALRNALRPVITMTGLQIGTMIAGATLTEIVFSYPGIGWMTYQAVLQRDYPVLMGVYLVVSLSVILANFVTDIVYALYDPRVRYA